MISAQHIHMQIQAIGRNTRKNLLKLGFFARFCVMLLARNRYTSLAIIRC
jgi:hypothetical protein